MLWSVRSLLFAGSTVALAGSVAIMEAGERALTTGVFVLLVVVVAMLYRRFRRSAGGVPWQCHAAAAIAVSLGVVTMLGGLGHSAAVVVVASREGEWATLTTLRFATGALLLYSGVMSVALHRSIGAGHAWAAAVATANCLLFASYLLFLLPLPGNDGTVPPMLGLWITNLIWLGAAWSALGSWLSPPAAPQTASPGR
jgi:hypothetical protein